MKIIEFSFDSTCRFKEKRYIFNFKNKDFLLISGDDEFADSILIIIDKETDEEIFEMVNIFLCSIAWTTHNGFQILASSSKPINNLTNLENLNSFLKIRRYYKNIINLGPIISIKDEKQEKALSLFNEAEYSNNIFYSFFCLWRILEIKYPEGKAANWIDNIAKSNPEKISDCIYLGAKNMNKSIGSYLYIYFRCAIAHCNSEPLKFSHRLNDIIEMKRMINDFKELVKFFIYNELKLDLYANKINNLKIIT
jgi:hypothetical protein